MPASQLMRDLLDYGKPPALKLAAVHPQDVIRRAVRACAALARERGVTLAEELSADLPQLEIDPSGMEQVLENLIANAVQHSPAGAAVRVVARLVPGPEPRVELSVEDEELLSEVVEEVSCRWCGHGRSVEELAEVPADER